jgi:hypothetical protein
MAEPPTREFGRRRPVAATAAPPVKRSGHVALLLMGTFAVGGGAYALMPGGKCERQGPGMAAPSLPQSSTECAPRGSSSAGGHGGSWSRSSLFGGDAPESRSSTGAASESGAGGVTRGGFGAFARAFTAHFSGGG